MIRMNWMVPLLYIILNLAIHFWFAHGAKGFDSLGHRIGTDSVFLANVARFEAQQNASPFYWWENFWPLNYWEPIQKVSPVNALAIPGKIFLIMTGPAWKIMGVIPNASMTWLAWFLLVCVLGTNPRSVWAQVTAGIFFLCNPLSLYLNTQISKEIPILLASATHLYSIFSQVHNVFGMVKNLVLFSLGALAVLWIRGGAQSLALLVVPGTILLAIAAWIIKDDPQLHRYTCLLAQMGFLFVFAWAVHQQKLQLVEMPITYKGQPFLKGGDLYKELDMNPQLWTRGSIRNSTRVSDDLEENKQSTETTPALSQIENLKIVTSRKTMHNDGWERQKIIPFILDNQVQKLCFFRKGFQNTPAATLIERPRPKNVFEALACLPQAAIDGIFLPLIDLLFSQDQVRKKAGLVFAPFFFLTLTCLALFCHQLFQQRGLSAPAIAILVFCGWNLILYGFVLLNAGTLLRIRHPYWVILITTLILSQLKKEKRPLRSAPRLQ